jgi:hypothetical protein
MRHQNPQINNKFQALDGLPQGKSPGTDWNDDWVDPTTGLDTMAWQTEKSLLLLGTVVQSL